VVYGMSDAVEAITFRPAPGRKRSLTQLTSALAEAGKCYAVVEDDEQPEFARLLEIALSQGKGKVQET
jgi:hypothetical protein